MVRLARALWIAWAVIVWNVVFDHVIVVAGRSYIHAAAVAFNDGRPYVRMDAWMRPAVSHGMWIASASGLAILLVGLSAIALAAKGDPCALRRIR